MQVCARCNNMNLDGAMQCAYCGAPLVSSAMPQQMPYRQGGQTQAQPSSLGLCQRGDGCDPRIAVVQGGPSVHQDPQAMASQPVPDYSQPLHASQAAYARPAGTPQSAAPSATVDYSQPSMQSQVNQPAMNHAYPAATAYPQPMATGYANAPATKNKMVAGLLALLLGGVGAHRFYLGNTTAGIINIAVWLTFIGGLVMCVIALVEGIKYLTMSQEQFEQDYVIGNKAWL